MFSTIRSLFFIALAVGIFFVYTNPTYNRAKTVGTEAATYDQALDSSAQFDQQRERIAGIYSSFSIEDMERLKTMVPTSVDNVRLVIDLQELAAKSGMSFKRVAYDAEAAKAARDPSAVAATTAANNRTDTKPYGTFTLTLTVSGTYPQLLTFLDSLEKSLRIIDVVGIAFTAPADDKTGDAAIAEYTIILNTYWLKN